MPIIVLQNGREITVSQGILIAEALKKGGDDPWLPCGGKGYCGRCRVQLSGCLQPPTRAEKEQLSPEELSQGIRLACQARIKGDVQVLKYYPLTGSQILIDGGKIPYFGKDWVPTIRRQEFSIKPATINDQRPDYERIEACLGREYGIPLSELSRLSTTLRDQGYTVTTYTNSRDLLKIKPGKNHNPPYGIAVDLGTTTVVAYLWDIENMKHLATAAALNPQGVCGEDIINRIVYANEQDDGLTRLQALALSGINGLMMELAANAGISPHEIYRIVLVGNTCMQHLLFGIEPYYLGQAPYTPVCRGPIVTNAAEVGFTIYPHAEVEFLPIIAGFIGSDALAAALAVNLADANGNVLLVDLGTNGEILLATNAKILACSTAAGPAFEGAGISSGMRACNGAIERLELNGEKLSWHVIGSDPPRGYCGSGLVDSLACMLRMGVLDVTGRILGPNEVAGVWKKHTIPGDNGYDFSLGLVGTPGITQRDVRKIQLAMGAVAAGVKTLLDYAGLTPSDLDEIVLAGGFGSYVNIDNAQRLGLIPAISAGKITYAGNAAGTGAQIALLSQKSRDRAVELSKNIQHLELAGIASFSQYFMNSMLFTSWQ